MIPDLIEEDSRQIMLNIYVSIIVEYRAGARHPYADCSERRSWLLCGCEYLL